MSLPIVLRIVTPEGTRGEYECDDVILYACDNADGEGGGSLGVHRGHAPAVIALEDDSFVTAKADGVEVCRVRVAGGFARVEDDHVLVVTPNAEEKDSNTDANGNDSDR